jgi:hypothetical protein
MQRCQRGSTKDSHNPNKHNNIILWADGWEKCIDALELLREADPEFHKKVKIVNTNYDRQGNKEQETILTSEVAKFCEWDTVRYIDSWEKKRQEWIQFYRDNNKNPSKHSNNLKETQLGRWMGQQRNNYKKHNTKWMTVERIRLLEEETPGWEWEKPDNWEEKRQKIIQFYDTHKRPPIKCVDNVDEKTLGYWQYIQRRNYKKKRTCMTSERIRLLEEETPGWEWEKSNNWEEKRQEWVKFYEENKRYPSLGSKEIREKQLGNWQQHQRRDYKNKEKRMTSERVRLLEDETPGWRWVEPDTWEEKRQEWVKFYEENKRYPSSGSKKIEETQLRQWQSDQRKYYKKKDNCMTPERIRLLEDETPGWRWEELDVWEEKRQEWLKFYQENKRNPLQSSSNIKEKQLARWQQTQRINYNKKEKRLTIQRIRILNEETPGWNWGKNKIPKLTSVSKKKN